MTPPTALSAAFVPMPLEDIPFFELDDGAKCYVGRIDDVCRHVEANGVENYYVLGTERTEVKETNIHGNTTTTIRKTPQVFHVTSTMMYRSKVPAPIADLAFNDMGSEAHFTLPPMPYNMVQDMDDFFRLVERQSHCEAIILLTFDPDVVEDDGTQSSRGWGILIPEQTNTGGHCDYKPESIVEEKPAEAFIVGSAHSHPGMSAFASPVDHTDQVDFDGLHITFGWQNSIDNGATQYHIELQIGGRIWSLEPKHVFEAFPGRVASEEVTKWADRVKKKTYANQTSTNSGAHARTHRPTTSAYESGSTVRNSLHLADITQYPEAGPKYEDNVVIGELLSVEEPKCPLCGVLLIGYDIESRRCTSCHSYICLPGESPKDLLKVRVDGQLYTHDIDVDAVPPPPRPIVIWRRGSSGNVYDKVYTPGFAPSPS